MTEDNPYWYWQAKHPNYWRRAEWHDYTGRAIYMITMLKAESCPAFSTIKALENNPDKTYSDLSPLGCIINNVIFNFSRKFPNVDIPAFAIMPDHVHIIVFIKVAGVTSLGEVVRSIKGMCSASWRDFCHEEILTSVFLKGYHDRILTKKGQYEVMKRYVRDNPRRFYVKIHHPEYFNQIREVEINGKLYKMRGNFYLLDSPSKMAVKISRRYTEEEKERYKVGWIDNASRGGVLVSPFIHPEEKEILKRCIEVGGNVIHIVEKGFGPRSKPYGIFFDLCAQGRLLEIAIDEFYLGKTENFRQKALAMNDLAALIALK